VREHVATARIPMRVASNGSFPLVQSVWFLFEEDALWCATQADAVLTRRLTRDPRCGFEISGDLPPYRGVRGTGHASIDPAAARDVLPRLITRYLGDEPNSLAQWLLSRLDSEVAIRIGDLRVTSWDYSGRM
jgi:hypothetical protein